MEHQELSSAAQDADSKVLGRARRKKSPDIDYLRRALIYDKETGLFRRAIKTGRKANVGDVAGCVDKDGYIQIRLKGKMYPAHRLAWLYVYGEWPQDEIDHINCIKGDNRISNLRIATRRQNSMNLKIYKSNKTGVKGVYWHSKRKVFVAQIRANGKRFFVGNFDDVLSASQAIERWRRELHGEFSRSK